MAPHCRHTALIANITQIFRRLLRAPVLQNKYVLIFTRLLDRELISYHYSVNLREEHSYKISSLECETEITYYYVTRLHRNCFSDLFQM